MSACYLLRCGPSRGCECQPVTCCAVVPVEGVSVSLLPAELWAGAVVPVEGASVSLLPAELWASAVVPVEGVSVSLLPAELWAGAAGPSRGCECQSVTC